MFFIVPSRSVLDPLLVAVALVEAACLGPSFRS